MPFMANKRTRECEDKILQTLASYKFNSNSAKYILQNVLERIDYYSYLEFPVKTNLNQKVNINRNRDD
ncbi:hypothetical protein HF867_02170 [Lactobacillus salivarius]|uniref:hypothetical protein n=1 Tax=Ligilactobacillus salivarius TaxID=1624 RepID=UPI0014756766|nr:hypothetical protein [Ligilactobacillus salivarius]NME23712.1 hypothetical protein [Ligilactobacillus salivarius]